MKKIFALIAAALFVVSCQEEIPESGNNTGKSSTPGKLTATIVVETPTRVTYAETPELNLQPAWEIGDAIIGFDDAGNTYTLTVASVSEETATLEGTVPDGALHLIYKSGAQASDISSKTLAIDYTAQAGDKTMPAVMLADGTVEDGSCHFAFTNAGAIIGISAVKGVPSGSVINKVTIEGENLSAATVALNGSALTLTAATVATDAISTAALSGITVTDANGTLSKPVFIAVPANAKIAKVITSIAKEPETMKIPSTAADKLNIDYVEIEAKYDGTNLSTKKWAKWNVGASSQSDYGWYFAWAGTEGYVRKDNKWVSVRGVDTYSYSPSSARTAGAGDYLYVTTMSFILEGHSFNFENTPYQTALNISSSGFTRFTKYVGDLSSTFKDPTATDEDALKTILDPEDDAAHVNWGGSWRMPTKEEFSALRDATYWAWNSNDKGYYVYAPNPTSDAGKLNNGTGAYSKGSALLFFPAAGYGFNISFNSAGEKGTYYTSSLFFTPEGGAFLNFRSSSASCPVSSYRGLGMSVRAISD